MSDRDNITLPREVVERLVATWDWDAETLIGHRMKIMSELVDNLRTHLAAEQPKVSATLNPDAMRTVSSGDAVLAASSVAVTVSSALAAEPTKQEPGLIEGLAELARQMKPLDADMAAILHDNLDSLYIEDEPTLAAEQPKPSEDAEALRRDAERYRWLREWIVRHSILCLEYGGRWALRKPHIISSSVGCGETEDAAIDAAMTEGKT